MSKIALTPNATGTGVFTISSPATNTDRTLLALFEVFEYRKGDLYWTAAAAHKVRGKIAGAIHKNGYRKIEFADRKYGAHQIVFALHYGYIPNFIDHINSNKSDNRIENLRVATKSQNGYNRGKNACNTSGCKNVYYRTDTKNWRVSMKVSGKHKCFGSYADKETAELVAYEARNKYHGEFANHV